MRRVPSVLLVAAVAVLAVAAAVDALRNGSETFELAPPRDRSAPGFAAAASALRAAGVAGTLVLSDEDCRLRALRLPGLERAPASRIQRCEAHVPTGGVGAFDGDVVWAGLGVGVVQVLVSQEELTSALGRRGHEAAGGFRAREAVPLVGGRHAAIAEAGGGDRLLVFLAGGRAERVVEGFLGGADSLRPSPGGRYVALFEAGEPGLRLFSADGRELGLPDVTGPRAIAWSPDERWTALATRASVFVYATDDPAGALVRIPVAARDLDWEADELLAAAMELREAGLRGVLTYSDEDCRLHSLALPDLAAHPAPSERRCRLAGVVRLRFGRPVGDPQRIVLARCRAGRVVVSELGGRTLASVPGCSPSWRPDGTLTAVREGEVMSLFPARVLLGRADIARELEHDVGDVELVEAAWLSGTRLAAVVRVAPAGEEPDVFAVFDGRRLVGRPVAFGSGLSGLRISPNGGYAAARSSRGGIVLDRQGSRVQLPLGVASLAWSQDEEWIAATRGGEIAFFPLDEPASPGIELPLAARDLVWR